MMLTYRPIVIGAIERDQQIDEAGYLPVSGDLKSGMPAEVLMPARS